MTENSSNNQKNLYIHGIEYRQMLYFIKVVDYMSFSRAAAELYVSQPLLSQCVTTLENQMGCQLLIREHGGVRPTPAGKVFADKAREIVSMANNLTFSVRRAASLSQPDKEIRVAASHDIPDAFLTESINEFKIRKEPRVVFHIYGGQTIKVIQMVGNGKADLGMIATAHDYVDKTLNKTVLGTVPLVFAAARRILESDSMESFIHTAKRYPTVLIDGDNMMYEYAMRVYDVLHIAHDFEFCSSIQELANRIQCGMGVAILPAADKQYWQGRDIAFRRIKDAGIPDIQIMAIGKKDEDDLTEAFVKYIRRKISSYETEWIS